MGYKMARSEPLTTDLQPPLYYNIGGYDWSPSYKNYTYMHNTNLYILIYILTETIFFFSSKSYNLLICSCYRP